MAAFLTDLRPFYGMEERNEDGLTLEEFLQQYDASRYEKPCVTADIIVLRSKGAIQTIWQGLKILMIQRKNHPSLGCYALPGGFLEIREDLYACAKRELMEETGLSELSFEQMHTFGEVKRDPRCRILTTSYLALVDDTVAQVKAGDDAKAALWMELSFACVSRSSIEIGSKKRVQETYELILSQEDSKAFAKGTVLVSFYEKSLLKESDLQVISQENIAFDHACIITQALLFLKERIELQK